jgi:putative endonuclease
MCGWGAAQRALPGGADFNKENMNLRKGFVYVLLSKKDNKRYIGSTININERLKAHNSGQVTSTKYRRPLKLKHLLTYENIKLAAIMERKFKRSSGTLDRELKKQGLL